MRREDKEEGLRAQCLRTADKETTVMTKVGRPPFLGVGHDGIDVLLEGLVVDRFKGLGIVEVSAKWIGDGSLLAENIELQRIGPPVTVSHATAASVGETVSRTLALGHFERFNVKVPFVFSDLKRNRSRSVSAGEEEGGGGGEESSGTR